MRTRTLSGLLLAILVATTSMSLATNSAEAHRYRGYGWGVAGAVAAGVILSEVYRPRYYRPYAYDYSRYPAYYGDPYFYDRPYYYYRPYRVYRPILRTQRYYGHYGYRAARAHRVHRRY